MQQRDIQRRVKRSAARPEPLYVSEAGQEQLRLWVDRCRRCLEPLEGERGLYCQRCDRQVFLETVR